MIYLRIVAVAPAERDGNFLSAVHLAAPIKPSPPDRRRSVDDSRPIDGLARRLMIQTENQAIARRRQEPAILDGSFELNNIERIN